jgi:DNA-binding LacI/PurR family transcriptional regulator
LTRFERGSKFISAGDGLKNFGCSKIYADVASGAKAARTGPEAAIDFARTRDTVAIWKLDRSGRSLCDLMENVNRRDLLPPEIKFLRRPLTNFFFGCSVTVTVNRELISAFKFLEKKSKNKRQATLSDIAATVGVAKMTVSRVINRNGYVSEETRQKVLQAAKELNYRRNGLARNLKRQRTETVGLVLGDIANPYSTELAHAIREKLLAAGFNLFICISEHSAKEDIIAFESLSNHNVDGIIVATRSNLAGDDYLRKIVDSNLPVVVVGRDFQHPAVDSVAADNLTGGFEATQHLIDLGHTRIGFIGASFNGRSGLKRLQGYFKALEQHHIEVDERLVTGRKEAVSEVPGYSTEKMGYEGMRRLLSLPNRPTAVFARNDFTAIGAMTAIKESGLRIPEDIAIVGFDDIPLAVHTSPPLTTVRQPMRLQGQMAAEMLLRRIDLDDDQPRQEFVLNCELIIRGSTVATK